MIGAAAFLVTNIVTWGIITLGAPHFSWPTATLLTFPFTFIVGQLAEGLAAWKSKAKLRDAFIRGAMLALTIDIIFTATQFFGTLHIQASDSFAVISVGVLLVAAGGALTLLGDLAPTIAAELVAEVKAERSLRQWSYREAVVADAAAARAGSARLPVIPVASAPPKPEAASKGRPPTSHRSVWS
ncbi:MAG: hypothetical protein ACYC9Q_13315 [Bacillota bacterium]